MAGGLGERREPRRVFSVPGGGSAAVRNAIISVERSERSERVTPIQRSDRRTAELTTSTRRVSATRAIKVATTPR